MVAVAKEVSPAPLTSLPAPSVVSFFVNASFAFSNVLQFSSAQRKILFAMSVSLALSASGAQSCSSILLSALSLIMHFVSLGSHSFPASSPSFCLHFKAEADATNPKTTTKRKTPRKEAIFGEFSKDGYEYLIYKYAFS